MPVPVAMGAGVATAVREAIQETVGDLLRTVAVMIRTTAAVALPAAMVAVVAMAAMAEEVAADLRSASTCSMAPNLYLMTQHPTPKAAEAGGQAPLHRVGAKPVLQAERDRKKDQEKRNVTFFRDVSEKSGTFYKVGSIIRPFYFSVINKC